MGRAGRRLRRSRSGHTLAVHDDHERCPTRTPHGRSLRPRRSRRAGVCGRARARTTQASTHRVTGRSRSLVVALTGVALALMPALALFGFTVDDALITARYAHHLAIGAGYRFNALGPVTDGVTPLGWALALAPFAHAGPL